MIERIVTRVEEHPDAVENRRCGTDRRINDRRIAAAGQVPVDDRRRTERRRMPRRADDVQQLLHCPDCRTLLEYDVHLSWSLPGAYTVDAGLCPSCSRRFMRDRATGSYDLLAW